MTTGPGSQTVGRNTDILFYNAYHVINSEHLALGQTHINEVSTLIVVIWKIGKAKQHI